MPQGDPLRPRRAPLDPTAQQGHLRLGETLALGRHLLIRIPRGHPRQHLAAARVARYQRSLAGLSRLERGGAGVEAQPPLFLVRPVALAASLHQDGLDLACKVHEALRAGQRGGRDGNRHGQDVKHTRWNALPRPMHAVFKRMHGRKLPGSRGFCDGKADGASPVQARAGMEVHGWASCHGTVALGRDGAERCMGHHADRPTIPTLDRTNLP